MSKAPNAPSLWDSQGCAVCRRQWETAERPDFVAENVVDHSELYRCTACGALWLMTERSAFVVQPEAIQSTYPGVLASAGSHAAGAMSVDPDLLSDGVVTYLGWPGSPHPGSLRDGAAKLAIRADIDPDVFLGAIHAAIAVSEGIPIASGEALTIAVSADYKTELRRRLPEVRDDAIDALASRAFWSVLWNGDGSDPDRALPAASAASQSRPDAPASDDGVQYWRHSVASTDHYFRMTNGRDFILRGDQWVPYDAYKSGPSWWRLTGEPGADVITRGDLPPEAPR
ncbi:hypothetical protein FBY40_0418 [Microbacterium sp. SLBN-154]|uniref:hypothetical protein n=1 Tax=Microbacterium sp. SLBN-154 TaxID=2768458 RepID=UPI001154E366|nr:hypothetical protein [Microbacterium sp. SLBN-154]TQK17936.1 hypothetical protein FBY40_0418 [Microbacterium sp. SLBN-154]